MEDALACSSNTTLAVARLHGMQNAAVGGSIWKPRLSKWGTMGSPSRVRMASEWPRGHGMVVLGVAEIGSASCTANFGRAQLMLHVSVLADPVDHVRDRLP